MGEVHSNIRPGLIRYMHLKSGGTSYTRPTEASLQKQKGREYKKTTHVSTSSPHVKEEEQSAADIQEIERAEVNGGKGKTSITNSDDTGAAIGSSIDFEKNNEEIHM